jgi:hypothetical protein
MREFVVVWMLGWLAMLLGLPQAHSQCLHVRRKQKVG